MCVAGTFGATKNSHVLFMVNGFPPLSPIKWSATFSIAQPTVLLKYNRIPMTNFMKTRSM